MTTLNRQPDQPDIDALGNLQARLIERLKGFSQRVRLHLALTGAAKVVVLTVGLAVLSLLLDRWLRLSVSMRAIADLLMLGVIGHRAWVDLVLPLRGTTEPVDLAAAIDRRQGNDEAGSSRGPIAARVATVLQLPDQLNTATPPSPAMVNLAVRRSAAELDGLSFDTYLDRKRLNQHLAGIGGALLLVLLLVVLAPTTMRIWASRWLMLSQTEWPRATYLELAGVQDGVLTVPRGEQSPLRVQVRKDSVMPGSVLAQWRDAKGQRHEQAMTQFAEDDYRLDLPPLYDEASLTVRGGDDRVGPVRVVPIDRPRITGLALRNVEHSDVQHNFLSSAPNPSYLAQTSLELRMTANIPLADVSATSESGASPTFERVDDTHYVARWTHDQPMHMSIELVARDAPLASLPLPITVGLLRDKAPRSSLRYTGVRQRVTANARIPLVIEARDDFGLVSVSLHQRIPPPEVTQDTPEATDDPAIETAVVKETVLYGPASPAISTVEGMSMELDLKALTLADDALLELWVRSTDAAEPAGQVGLSRVLAFRITPSDQLFREILMRLQADRARLRKLTTAAEQLRDDLLLSVTADKYDELARRHRALQREAARVAGSIQEAVTEMKLNELGSVETQEMIQHNVADRLFEVVSNDMVTQRQTLDELARSPGDTLHRQASERQTAIVAAMEDVLKQMAQWDSFIDVLNQLEEIIRLQKNIRDQTKNLEDGTLEGVFED